MAMEWQRRLGRILRWPAVAVGATATAAGSSSAAAEKETGWQGRSDAEEPVVLPNTLNSTAVDKYAAHRSHSSHRSHRSHRSSGGSRSYTPPPSYSTPSPQPSPSQSIEQKAPSVAPKPSAQDLSLMVVRVQAALMRLGYYDGDIDGLLGPMTRSAIEDYQKAQGLKQTGRMDIDTLTRLGIPIP